MKTQRRILSLLLILAMLTVAFAALFPAAVSAENAEIQDFECLCSSRFAIGSENTDLLFLFSIGSLNYSNIGFVFSFEGDGNNTNPTIGGTGCYIYQSTAAYSSYEYEGEWYCAPTGRWWVGCKVTNIPFPHYSDWIYVRAFVADNVSVRYSNVMKINVQKANRGEGKSINEAIGTSSTGSSAYIEYKRGLYTQVLNYGERTFCPNEVNPDGNDLMIEYSVLYNEYLVQYLNNNNGPYVTARIGKYDFTENSAVSWWTTCANCYDSYSVYPGGFEKTGSIMTPISDSEVTTPAGMVSPGGSYADYPNIGGSNPNNPEYGWHRIGIRIHEDVTTLPTATRSAEYRLTVTTYVDGVAVAKLQGPLNANRTANYLYTASYNASTGEVEYTDVGFDRFVFLYRMKYKGNNTGANKSAYCVFADAYATCGKEFVQQVERVNPVANGPHDGSYRAGNEKKISAPRYYHIVPDHSFGVMSYNIEGYGHGGEGWDGRNPAKALQTVIDESPDIVGFQEADAGWDPWIAQLAQSGCYTRLEGLYTTDHYTNSNEGSKNEILFKTDKFDQVGEGTLYYKALATELNVPNPENADMSRDNHGRTFHYAILRQKSTGELILVINTHLHYGKTGGDNSEPHDKVRRYEIRTMLAWLEDQELNLPVNQIVLGDMNLYYKASSPNNPGTQAIQLFLNEGFEWAPDAAAVTGDVGGTLDFIHRTSRVDANGKTWAFDNILSRGYIDTEYYSVINNPIDNGNYPSDHIPIMARFCLQ
ncbi:MAG: endonuclease/exonuclease/phosphatase family protein [Clostridia bacterium]|nr:endonuclease/exonuclease/phosphatase family protein [Clostridia bacterium]